MFVLRIKLLYTDAGVVTDLVRFGMTTVAAPAFNTVFNNTGSSSWLLHTHETECEDTHTQNGYCDRYTND